MMGPTVCRTYLQGRLYAGVILACCFLMALFCHQSGTFQPELYPGVGVDAVVNAVVAGNVTAGHTAVSGVDNGVAAQGGCVLDR